MSDINYDASICRNIMVDARFILFIIDKYAGATHLIDEMKLVHPKSDKMGTSTSSPKGDTMEKVEVVKEKKKRRWWQRKRG